MNLLLRLLRPRVLALLMYLAYFLTGLCFVFLPTTDTVRSQVHNPVSLVIWHIFLVLGGITSAIGARKKVPAVEAFGIPLLLSSVLVYVLVLFVTPTAPLGSRLGLGCFFLGTGFGLAGRLGELVYLMKVDQELERRGD